MTVFVDPEAVEIAACKLGKSLQEIDTALRIVDAYTHVLVQLRHQRARAKAKMAAELALQKKAAYA